MVAGGAALDGAVQVGAGQGEVWRGVVWRGSVRERGEGKGWGAGQGGAACLELLRFGHGGEAQACPIGSGRGLCCVM